MSKEKLIEQMQDSLAVYPGIIFAFSQPIQDNVEEYVAGVKSALVIKIFGNDLYTLELLPIVLPESLKVSEGWRM